MESDISQILVTAETSILDTIRVIDLGAEKVALLVDGSRKLLGIVSDGDVRRGLLQGIGLNEPVSRIMNSKPVTLRVGQSRDVALSLMRRLVLHQIPVVDEADRVVGLETIGALVSPSAEETPVVLMAGGLGTRLRPLTNDTPKSMLKVGGRPLLETIIANFTAQGYRRFVLSLNYKAEVFCQYFGDGAEFGVEIDYVIESKRLGTAGALSLLSEQPVVPFIVMNGDLLTSVNFHHLLAFHRQHQSLATMCICDYSIEVPYGVIRTDGVNLAEIVEKPVHRFHVNAGIYVLDPRVLELIPQGSHFDMPQLFEAIQRGDGQVSVFPIHEYWLDIGRVDDLERAHREWPGESGND